MVRNVEDIVTEIAATPENQALILLQRAQLGKVCVIDQLIDAVETFVLDAGTKFVDEVTRERSLGHNIKMPDWPSETFLKEVSKQMPVFVRLSKAKRVEERENACPV